MNLRISTMACLLAIVGCGESGTPAAESESTGTTAPGSESTGSPCAPGTEGCPCDQGTCSNGLACMADECVAMPDDDTSSTAIDGSSEAGSTESSSSGEAESSTSTSSESDTSGDESSTTEAMPLCLEWDRVCVDAVQSTCLGGEWQDVPCDDVCAPFGFTSSGCEAVGNDCVCDSPNDAACEHATEAWCVCYEYYTGTQCDFNEDFAECFDGSDPALPCFGDYYVNGQINCEAAVDACL